MYLITSNRVKTAKNKLSQHRILGERSQLTIFQVAKLMDTIRKGEDPENYSQDSIFFSLN